MGLGPLADPRFCGQSVVFDATTTDADQHAVTHTWEVSGIGTFYGDTLSLALPAGDYEIALLAEDPTYLFDVEEKRYTRACQ